MTLNDRNTPLTHRFTVYRVYWSPLCERE